MDNIEHLTVVAKAEQKKRTFKKNNFDKLALTFLIVRWRLKAKGCTVPSPSRVCGKRLQKSEILPLNLIKHLKLPGFFNGLFCSVLLLGSLRI